MIQAVDPFRSLSDRWGCEEFRQWNRSARAPRLRGFEQFAPAEIVIPEGRYEGQRLRYDRQPFVRLLYREFDSGRWNRFATTGCVQSGKSLNCFVTPIVRHLFELNESVICGLPTMDIAGDKWREEILPIIERTRYRHLLPDRGIGSRGGKFESITFRNGPTLKFMTGHGGDEKRSSFTARVVVVTEADKMDEASESSREADPVSQLEARTFSWDEFQRLIYLECTTSIKSGRIWQEYQKGSASRIYCGCPYGKHWIHPGRECLLGWQEASDEIEAFEKAFFACPECGAVWTEADRLRMNLGSKLVHRGQEIDGDGEIHGDLPRTQTLGFRWDAFNNLFWSTGTIGLREWRAAGNLNDSENAERELRQFWWALPALPPSYEEHPLDETGLAQRIKRALPRGVAPPWTDLITVGVDLGKYLAHWVAIAWRLDGTAHVVDYGRFDIPSEQLGVENGIHNALSEFADTIKAGWQVDGKGVTPASQVWVDARYFGKAVYPFVAKQGRPGEPWRASLGYGAAEERFKTYSPPKSISKNVQFIGDAYHIAWLQSDTIHQAVAETNADEWKSFLHARLRVPKDAPGAMTLFSASPKEHLSFFKHLTAESETREWVPEKGFVKKFVRHRKSNHWLDAGYLACVAAHWKGVRVIGAPGPQHQPQTARGGWFANAKRA